MDKQLQDTTTESQEEARQESVTEQATEQETPSQEAPTSEESAADDSGSPEYDWLEKAPSEAELRGEVPEEEPGTNESDQSRPSGDKDTEIPEKDGDGEPADDKGEAKPEDGGDGKSDEDAPAKDDEGNERTVPLKALQEERKKRQEAQNRLKEAEDALTRERTAREAGTAKPKKDAPQATIPEELLPDVQEFQKKYPEYAAMATEDTPEGKGLRVRLEDYGPEVAADYAHGKTLELKVKAADESARTSGTTVFLDNCVTELNGLFPEGTASGETATKAVSFASERGLSSETILALTNPKTVLVDPETGSQVYLGRKAIEVAGFVKDAYDFNGSVDTDALRAELEQSIRAEVTKELTEKFRGGGDGPDFRSLGDGPGSSEKPEPTGATMSEADFARLSPEEQAKHLGG